MRSKIFGYGFAICFILAVWSIGAQLLHSPALPTPLATIDVLGKNLDTLAPYFATSAWRVVISIVIGTVLAVPIAQFCCRSKRFDALFAPVLYLLYPIPKVVFLPILLVFFGLGDTAKIVLISLTIFFQVLVAVRDGVLAIPKGTMLSARALCAGKWSIYWNVIAPSTAGSVFTSLRVSVGTAIAVLFIAEAMAGSTGLGYFIMQSWSMVDYPRMFAGIVALALLGLVLYALFDAAQHALTRWR